MPVSEHKIIDKARNEARTALTEIESKKLIGQAGIDIIETRLAASRDEAIAVSNELGFPVAIKISSPDVLHKSDIGGVKLGLKTPAQVGKAYDEVLDAVKKKNPQARIEGVAVQQMARPGVEVTIGMSKDAQFGPVLMFGLGGVWVEILKDVSFRIVPLSKKDATQMIREIKGYPLLAGYRGQKAADVSKLEDFLLKLSDLAEKNATIKEIDLNPIYAYSDGAVVVDARVILEDEETEERRR